jgi:hypothetical protein
MAKGWASFVLVLFLVLAANVAIEAQSPKPKVKPDFSGNWLLDQKKSSDSGLTRRPDLPIKISHHDPEFRVTLSSESNGQIIEREFVYFTDARGETNTATTGLTTNPSAIKADDLKNQVMKSKTKWSANKIVTRSQLRLNVAGRFVEFEQTDEWKLSADGKVLTQTSRVIFQNSNAAFIPAMVPDRKRVYNRG